MALRWFSLIKVISLAIAIAMPLVSLASVTQPKWPSKTFVYRAENKRLVEVIQDFASSQGVPVIVDVALEGTVNVSFNRSPAEFLTTLSKSYGVIWYFDGVTLFAYPARAMQSKVFRLRGFKREQVRQMLESLPQEEQQKVFQSLPLEKRLAGLSVEEIRHYLDQLTAGHTTEARKPRRKR